MAIPIPISTPSPKELQEYVTGIYKKWKQSIIKKKLRAAIEGRKNPNLYKLLRYMYPEHQFLCHNEKIFPIAIIELPEHQFYEPESILGKLNKNVSPKVDEHLAKAGQKYIDFLKELGLPLWDLPTFCFDSIRKESDGSVKIDCSLGSYFNALRTCDILEWELLTVIATCPEAKRNFDYLANKLEFRGYIHSLSKDKDPVINPVGRSAAIGISTLVLFNRGRDFCILVGERSNQGVAVHGDLYHVIPSFMFQPVVGDIENEFSIIHNIFREYLEELFGLSEVQEPPSVISYDYFYENPNLLFLRKLINQGDAKIFLTGFVVNLLNLRPEICTLIYVKSPEWYMKHKTGKGGLARIEFNEEWKKPFEKTKKGLNVVSLDDLEEFDLNPENTVPPGAAAIHLGLKVAENLRLLK